MAVYTGGGGSQQGFLVAHLGLHEAGPDKAIPVQKT